MEGYSNPSYVASLNEFGTPRFLGNSGCALLTRPIENTGFIDAMGSYPLFFCQRWEQLEEEFREKCVDLVSIALVTDPFGSYDVTLLKKIFTKVNRFKLHYVTELSKPISEIVKKSHRATTRRAQKHVDVRICDNPILYLDKWQELWENLVERYGISGLRSFSRNAFAIQLGIPGMIMFEALAGNETVGLDLWYVQDNVAYGHLAAFSKKGYELRASYATKWFLLEYFRGKVMWVDFGAGAGAKGDEKGGLTVFKEGWSTGTKPVYFCGKIIRTNVYEQLVAEKSNPLSNYFPAYRVGEFS